MNVSLCTVCEVQGSEITSR